MTNSDDSPDSKATKIPPKGISATAPLTSVLYVTWNAADHIGASLESVSRELAGVPHEIVVVDNDSSDETLAVVRSTCENARIFQQGFNSGFAAGVNSGISKSRGRWLLLINPDTRLVRGTSAAREWLAEHLDYAILAAQLEDSSGELSRSDYQLPSWRIWLMLYWLRHTPRSRVPYRSDQPFQTEAVVGACLWVSRAAIDRVGGMDPRFWLYTEEIDWCRRFRETGYHLALDPHWRVYHEGAGSAKQLGVKAFVALHESRRQYVEKYSGGLGQFFFRGVVILGFIPGVFAAAFSWIGGRISGSDARLRIAAYWAAVCHLTGVRRWVFP